MRQCASDCIGANTNARYATADRRSRPTVETAARRRSRRSSSENGAQHVECVGLVGVRRPTSKY